MNLLKLDFGRRAFIVGACVFGIFLVVVALGVVSRAFAVLLLTFWYDGKALNESVDACAKLFNIAGVATGGVLYLVRLVFQREFDAAVELTVEVTPTGGSPNSFELLAKLKNVTTIAAGIESLTYKIRDASSDAELQHGDWIRPPGDPPILTRNTTWQLATLFSMPSLQPTTQCKLVATCRIGLQPTEQAIQFEKLFTIIANKSSQPNTGTVAAIAEPADAREAAVASRIVAGSLAPPA